MTKSLLTMVALAASLVGLAFASHSSAGPDECGPGGTGCCDSDGDTICDHVDNCLGVVNPSQRDDDLDGYGNICDGDLNQDCILGGADFGLISGNWLAAPPWSPSPVGNGTTGAFDINQDNIIGGADVGVIAGNWLDPAGPSGYACSRGCVGTTQVGPPPVSCL